MDDLIRQNTESGAEPVELSEEDLNKEIDGSLKPIYFVSGLGADERIF
ncbi:MAG: hypothetical protein AAGB19_09370 [Cyanobacteria bacterium P01_F01_bin.3]